ncbi:MAG: copper chaperone PCu(A)C [Gemmatimonadota bacterium]
MRRIAIFPALSLLLAGACSQRPPLARVGDIALLSAYAHPSAGDAGAAYFRLKNLGTVADSLVAAQGPDSSSAMIMGTSNGHMTMADAVVLPPGQTVDMIPGAMHVMFSGLTQDYAIGDTLRVTLRFARAGELRVAAPVVPYGEMPE